ncbi:uncharacterized protein LOC134608815 isoform X1 [Pelobates fuscus]|uniref:uncharacterized protein LOC134608815 isoform X1 n=1 Tax=Pelobates fuscus TaxID=191477 RepID=UPI002FE42F2F
MEDMSRISASVTVFLLYVLLWLTDVQCINFSECPKYVTDSHLGYLDNMIESQMESSCAIDVKLLKKGTLSDYCYTRGLIYQLGDLIRKNLKFRNNSVYQNNTAALLSLYNDQITKCVLSYNDGNKIKLIKKPNVCDSDIESLSPVQILEKVKQLFIDAKNFRIKYHTDNDCEELYERECENDERKAGPSQCDCPSPTPSNLLRTTIQKPPREISVFRRSTHSSVVHPTKDSAEEISENKSGTTTYKSTGLAETLESRDFSSTIFTDMSTESGFPHGTMEYDTTTLPSVSSIKDLPQHRMSSSQPYTDFQVGMKPTKGSSDTPFYSMKPTGTGTTYFRTALQQLTQPTYANTVKSLAYLVISYTNKNNPYFGKSLSPTTDSPYTNKLYLTSEPSVEKISQNPDAERSSTTTTQNLFSASSMEVDKAFTHSTVTKMHHATGMSEKTFKTPVETHASNTPVSVGSTSEYSSLGSSRFSQVTEWDVNTKFDSDRSLSLGDETKENNLGWADTSLTFASSMQPATFSRTEQLILSPDTKVSMQTKTTVHEGGGIHQIPLQSEGNIAALTSQERGSDGAGPRPGSNPLLVIKTESKVDETHRQKNLNLIIVAVLGVLGIMFLCGLLYGLHYKRKYRMLKRQLNRPQQDPESPEERPLNNQEIELEEL